MSSPDVFEVVALAHGKSGGDALVMVMVCYLDDSDAEHSSVGTLAGYVASVDNWKLVEAHLQRVCNDYGVDVLHAKEFHDTKGCFKNWSRVKKNTFVDELYATEGLITWGVSYSGSKDWPEIKNQVDGNERMSLYGVIFAAILFKIAYGNPLSKHIRDQGLSFMVESGHRNNSEIEQYFHRMKGNDTYKDVIKSITFVDKHSSRSIQLADFLAFHARRRAALASAKKLGTTLPATDIIGRIYKKLPHFECITPEGMRVRAATLEEAQANLGGW